MPVHRESPESTHHSEPMTAVLGHIKKYVELIFKSLPLGLLK